MPISRVYSVDDGELRCYKGFDRNVQTARIVAIIKFEDVYECWAVDDRESFLQFLQEEKMVGMPYELVGFFVKT